MTVIPLNQQSSKRTLLPSDSYQSIQKECNIEELPDSVFQSTKIPIESLKTNPREAHSIEVLLNDAKIIPLIYSIC